MDAEILVAEDESAIREGLCALLESEGYTVRAAVDGEDALRLFGECRPDLVLLDVMMPKKNGYAVCSEIRSSDQDVPILCWLFYKIGHGHDGPSCWIAA